MFTNLTNQQIRLDAEGGFLVALGMDTGRGVRPDMAKGFPMPPAFPSIGCVVWYYPSESCDLDIKSYLVGSGPLAALITRVHADYQVNLAVFDEAGRVHGRPSVYLGQPPASIQAVEAYCLWPDHQTQGDLR